MKWVKLQTFERFVLWKNIKNGCRECFWKEIDPNMITGSARSSRDYNRKVTVNGKTYYYL